MSRVSPVWIAIGVAAIIAAAVILYNVRRARLANPGPVGRTVWTMPRERPDDLAADGRRLLGNLEVSGPSIVQRDAEGNEKWSAKSEGKFEIDDAEKRVTATDVLWKLAGRDEEVSIEAGRMEFGWRGGDLTFEGDVAIQAGEDRRFSAHHARFEPGTDKVICERGVEWKIGRFNARADTLVLDVNSKKVRLRGHVRLAAE